MALAVIGVFPKPNVQANNYDVVIETTIGQDDYKVLEINNTTGDVNFYEFTVDGDPVLDGNNEQTTFVPGDNDFEDRIAYLATIFVTKSVSITAVNEFSFQLYCNDYNSWDVIIQLCFDGSSSTDYRIVQYIDLVEPFSENDPVGTFSYITVNEYTYNGYSYTPDEPQNFWTQQAISGDTGTCYIASEADESKLGGHVYFKITGTLSDGTKVKIETDENGKVRVYKGNDKNGDGEIGDDEWEEVEDEEEIENIIDEAAEDIENGTGDWEGEAYDKSTEPPTPIDAIIWLKRKDGTYTGFKITYSNGSFGLDAKTQCSKNCMITAGYLDDGPDTNPDGAWTVGGRNPSNNNNWWYFEKFARFNGVLEFYTIGTDAGGKPFPWTGWTCPTFLMMYGDSFWPSCC
jgi:hypothetical protein